MNRQKLLVANFALALLCGPLAFADSVNLQTFSLVMNTKYVLTEDASTANMPQFFSAQYNFLNNPLVQYDAARVQRAAVVVGGINTLDLAAGASIREDLFLGLSVPLSLVHFTDQPEQFGVGDLRLMSKVQLTSGSAPIVYSLIPEISLPTGDIRLLLSSSSAGGGVSIAAERDFKVFRAAANLGYRYTPGAIYQDINFRQQFPMALGVYGALNETFGVNAELKGAVSFPVNHFNNPGEFYLGGQAQVARGASVVGGISLGSLDSSASGNIRMLAGIRFVP